MKGKVIFEERVNGYKILIDLENHTFVVYRKGVARGNGYWRVRESGEIELSPLGKKEELLLIRGVVLRGERDKGGQSIVLLRSKKRESELTVNFYSDGEEVAVNLRDNAFAVINSKGVTEIDGCFSVHTGEIFLDPIVGQDGQRKKKKTLGLEGLILQNKRKKNSKNFILLKKK